MNFIEFIGFIITMAALFFLYMRQALEERKRRQNPEAYEEDVQQEQESLKQFLKTLDIDLPEEKPAKKEKPEKEKEQKTLLFEEEMKIEPVLPKQALTAYGSKREKPSRGRRLVRSSDSLRDLMVLREILGPATAMRDERRF